jgi:hypothetical protein
LTDKSDTSSPVAQSTASTQPITDRSRATSKLVEKVDSVSWFVPEDRHFTSAFAIREIAMDGNCLFRAILSACGIDDEQYHEHLRAICVKEVVADWNNLSTYANFIHRVDRDNNDELPFPNAQAYANYMGRVGEWGSDLEASVIAKKTNRPILLWIASTRRHGTLLNFIPVERSKIKATAHILHSGNHYSALIFQNGIEENYYLSSLVAQSAQMFGRGFTNDHPMHVRSDV